VRVRVLREKEGKRERERGKKGAGLADDVMGWGGSYLVQDIVCVVSAATNGGLVMHDEMS